MRVTPLGYATPRVPIRVTLGRDEAALNGSRTDHSAPTNATKAVAPPPPAYGLWRESVVSTPTPADSPIPAHQVPPN